MKRFAFFDVDNTIYNGYTAIDILYFLIERKIASPKLAKAYEDVASAYHQNQLDYHATAQKGLDIFSMALSNKTIGEIKKLVPECFQNKKSLYFKWVAQLLEFLRESSFQIILISAGPDVAIKKIAEEMHADAWYATSIPSKNGRFTGEPTNLLNDTAKIEAIKNFVNSNEDSLSIGFGDSPGDAAMLDTVDYGFLAMNNDHHAEVWPVAKAKGWTVFENENQVIKKVREIIRLRRRG